MSVRLPDPARVDDRTIVITGGSSGIGRAAANALADLGANVVVVGRTPERVQAAAKEVRGRGYLADFTSLASVRDLAERLLADLPQIHVLANNAGGLTDKQTTVDGFDATFQQNHLSGFLLTNLLLDRIRSTAQVAPAGSVRIIQTSSVANRSGKVRLDDLDNNSGPWLKGMPAYSNSKLENILFTRELARRLRGTGVSSYAFHPGAVRTNFAEGGTSSGIFKLLAISPEKGAEPLVRLAAAPVVPAPSGNYFHRLKAPGPTAKQALDRGLMTALWQESERRAGLG